jgi:hypothetical protein
VAFSLGVRGRGGGVVAEVVERIGARRMLLVLDGLAPGSGGATSLVVDLLRACPGLRVLATSRSGLRATGELAVPVAPLGGPEGAPAHLDAAKMFLDLLSPSEAGPWKEKPSETVRLCNLLKGNPLAISLAAGMAASMTPSTFEVQLRQRVQMAGQSELESVTPDRLVQVLVSWSLDVQPVGNLAVLLRASPFVGAWSLRAIRAVGGAGDAMPSNNPHSMPTPPDVRIADQLERLIRAGLVRRTARNDDPAVPCYRLPDAVRRELVARLHTTPGAAAMVQGGYMSFINALAGLAGGPLTPATTGQLEGHYAELSQAASRGSDAGGINMAQEALLRHYGLA